jgi:hypothetical protein
MAGLLSFLGALSPNEDGTPNALQRFDNALHPEQQLQQLQMQQALIKLKQEQATQSALQNWAAKGDGDLKSLYRDMATADPSYLAKFLDVAGPKPKTATIGGNIVQYDEKKHTVTPKVIYSQPTADERKQTLAEQAKKEQEKATITAGEELLPVMNTALKQIGGGALGTEGLGGMIARNTPFATTAKDLEANIGTIKSRIGLDELAKLKAASPTGASGLGSQSVKEQEALQSSIASLDSSQSDEQRKNNLLKIKKHYVGYLESLGYTVPDDLKSGSRTVADEVATVPTSREEWLKRKPNGH